MKSLACFLLLCSSALGADKREFHTYDGPFDLRITQVRSIDHPLINETHLDGKFDFHVRADEGQQNNFTERLRTQLNLVVTPAQRHVEMLVFTPQ